MTTSHASPASNASTVPELHVFQQAGGWHWGITIPRAAGGGFKLIAFSEQVFAVEDAARADGSQALARLADSAPCNPARHPSHVD